MIIFPFYENGKQPRKGISSLLYNVAGYIWTDYKTNTVHNFGQITGIQEKLDTTCYKQNAL
jgi:hypothetical protein